MDFPAVRLKSVCKSFGSNQANRNVSFDIEAGTIHAVIGENGAGKSTIMNILFGFYVADSGEIEIFGKHAKIHTPTEALELGIGMIHQHFMLVEDMTVAENIVLGIEQTNKYGQLTIDQNISDIREFSDRYGLSINPTETIENLTVGEKQRVEIIKALFRKARILILDEPSAVLTPQEVKDLFRILRSLKEEGITIVIITHKLDEVLEISDKVTVMRAGEVAGELATKDATPQLLARMMVGRDVLLEGFQSEHPAHLEPILSVQNLCAKQHSDKPLDHISFDIYKGEILGIAGVSGNGQTTLEAALCGLMPVDAGDIWLNGSSIKHLSIRERRGLKLGHVPSDREKYGFVEDFTNAENFILGYHDSPEYCSKMGFMKLDAVSSAAIEKMREFDVRPLSVSALTGGLSGGNKQKLVLAREIARQPEFLIIAEPTRGVDIGAIETIRKFIMLLKEQGAAILLISSDLDEIGDLSDRACVFYKGRIMGYFDTNSMNKEKIGLMMTGQTV